MNRLIKNAIRGILFAAVLFAQPLSISAQQGQNPDAQPFNSLERSLPFGSKFFREAADRMRREPEMLPVPREYRIGPGDEVSLVFQGAGTPCRELTVDRRGILTIPGIGSVFVSGMTYGEMSKRIAAKYGETGGARVSVKMAATPGKTISVTVKGHVHRPGRRTIGYFATATDAVIYAGGPTDEGTMRNILVRRKGETIASCDLYDLLLKGFRFRDVTLMEGDEIFVPERGPLVEIKGEVDRPAVYEMKGRPDLEQLIELAGGVISPGVDRRVQVERLNGKTAVIVYESNRKKNPVLAALQDRDRVRISAGAKSVVKAGSLPSGLNANNHSARDGLKWQESPADERAKYVTLSGQFARPGKYAIRKGEKLSSIIERAGGYSKNAYLRGAVFTRESVRQIQEKSLREIAARTEGELEESEFKKIFIVRLKSLKAAGRLPVNISHLRLLKGSSSDIELEDGDSLFLPEKPGIVGVAGAVMSEGARMFKNQWKLDDYIGNAGGFARYADEKNVFLLKVDGTVFRFSRGPFEWNYNKERWEIVLFGKKREIEPGDTIIVPDEASGIKWLKGIRDLPRLLANVAAITGERVSLY